MLPNQQNELFYQVALSFVPDVGPKTARVLLSHFGKASEIFNASKKDLSFLIGANKAVKFVKDEVFGRAETELDFALKHEVQILFIADENYPKRFLHCDDAPVLLYYKGNANLNTQKVLAIVGTRQNTDYGQRSCEMLLDGLAGQEDLLVTSGLALGIDTIAHKAALKNGFPTVGAMGNGIDMVYPYRNRGLAEEMIANGGIITEFPSGTGPDRHNFPVRNRVVAGMSDITVVVESDVKGGAMITAYLANSYNREVAAFPGRVFDSKSGGPNHLIRKNIAAMITSAEDLVELMNWNVNPRKKSIQKQLFVTLSQEEEALLNL